MTNLPSLVTSPLPLRTSPVRSANIRLLEMKMARKRMAAPKWTRSLDRCANSAGQRIVIERREGGRRRRVQKSCRMPLRFANTRPRRGLGRKNPRVSPHGTLTIAFLDSSSCRNCFNSTPRPKRLVLRTTRRVYYYEIKSGLVLPLPPHGHSSGRPRSYFSPAWKTISPGFAAIKSRSTRSPQLPSTILNDDTVALHHLETPIDHLRLLIIAGG